MNRKTVKRDYCRPHMAVYNLKMSAPLLAGSITESTGDATDKSTGTLDSRSIDFYDEEW